VVLVLAGAGYWGYRTYLAPKAGEQIAAPPSTDNKPPQTAAAEPPKKSVRDTVNDYLAGKPTPEAMLAKGKEFAQGGDLTAAFLVWRRAAEAGNVLAQLEIGAFYDPLTMPARAGFTPDAARAADWYERAALAGNAEAQRRFGLLLAKGGTGLSADAVKAKSWLQQAAAQNDADAKKALEAMPK
jgi:TPR repeat protein